MRCVSPTWEAQRTGGSPLPEKIEGPLGSSDGEQMSEGMLWWWQQDWLVDKVFGTKTDESFSCR